MGSKCSLLMKFGQFMSHCKRKNSIKKFCKNGSLKTSSRPFCVCKELSTASIGKWNFLKQTIYIRYIRAKLSKVFQISMMTSSDSFLQRILWKLKRQAFIQALLRRAVFCQRFTFFSVYLVKYLHEVLPRWAPTETFFEV